MKEKLNVCVWKYFPCISYILIQYSVMRLLCHLTTYECTLCKTNSRWKSYASWIRMIQVAFMICLLFWQRYTFYKDNSGLHKFPIIISFQRRINLTLCGYNCHLQFVRTNIFDRKTYFMYCPGCFGFCNAHT